jgi:hypothetical protein
VIVPDGFLDARLEPLTPSEKIILLNIEARARSTCWSYPGNHELAARAGRKVRAIQYILDSLQDKGYILPILKAEGREFRLCFLLLKRANSDRPVFDPDHDDLDQIMDVVCGRRGIRKPKYKLKIRSAMGAKNCTHHGCKKLPAPWVQFFAPESDEVVSSKQRNKNQSEESPESGISAPSTRRLEPDPTPPPETGTPQPSEPPPTPHQAIFEPLAEARTGPILEGLTAGQRAFVEALDEGQRAAFGAMGQSKRDWLLGPHKDGFDLVIADFQRRTEIASRPPEPPRPMPETTEDLIAQLPGACQTWALRLAEHLVQAFDSREDRKLWGELHKVAMAIWDGRIDPEDALKAYRGAMRPSTRNRGGYFWRALKRNTGITEDDL